VTRHVLCDRHPMTRMSKLAASGSPLRPISSRRGIGRLFFRSTWAAVLALMAVSLGDCTRSGSADPATAAPASPSSSATPSNNDLVVKFSDPGNAGVFAYAKREGILERELAKVNAKVAWIPAAGAFSANFEAMNSGAMNASGGAISPIIGALSHNLQFKIYAIADPSGATRSGIISPASSAIRTVKDLVGKRVAVNLAAKGDYVLLKALANAGIPATQVERLPIQPPDAAAAFATGKIDAWSTFGTFFSTAIRNGAHVLAVERDLQSDDVSVLAANVAVLQKNPAAFQVILRVSRELTGLAHQSPEKFENVFKDKGPTALSGEELRIATEETRVAPAFRVPSDVDKTRIRNVAEIFFDNKSIDRRISVDDIVFDVDRAAKP
jgi:sulfonate transport system substrate-binding protein